MRILVWSAWVSVIWLVGALLDGNARACVWIVVVVLDYAGPLVGHRGPGLGRSVPTDRHLVPGHFSDRLQPFVMVALGETIAAAGVTAAALEVDATRIAAVVVSSGVSVAFWWLYFDSHAEGATRTLRSRETQRDQDGRTLSYVHVPIAAGIAVSAVAAELVIAHLNQHLRTNELIPLAAGPVLFLTGTLICKASVLHVRWHQRDRCHRGGRRRGRRSIRARLRDVGARARRARGPGVLRDHRPREGENLPARCPHRSSVGRPTDARSGEPP